MDTQKKIRQLQNFGESQLRKGSLSLAADNFENILKIDPDNVDALCGLGIACLGISPPGGIPGPARAIIYFTKALEIGLDDSGPTVINLADAYRLSGNGEMAFAVMRKYILEREGLAGVCEKIKIREPEESEWA